MWEADPVPAVDVDALLNRAAVTPAKDVTAAEAFIADLLADASAWPLDAKTAIEAGQQHGIPERTVRWTAKRMGVRIERIGFAGGGRWVWHRPTYPASPSPTSSVAGMNGVAAIDGSHPAVAAPAPHSGNSGNPGNRSGGGDVERY